MISQVIFVAEINDLDLSKSRVSLRQADVSHQLFECCDPHSLSVSDGHSFIRTHVTGP